METNLPRNSQPGTHPDDKRRRWPRSQRLHRMERFPDALENSSSNAPRSGLLVMAFELGGRQIAERGMQPLLVIDLFEELADRSTCFSQVPVFVAMDFVVLQRFHERFAGRVVPRIALARHADFDAVGLEQVRIVVAGILGAAIGMMDESGSDDAARST